MGVKIAVYTIAKSEEKFAERWAKSCTEADFRIVADTGSSDNTCSVLRKNGVRVYNISIKPWRFDDARNASLALVPEDVDICICLDMDEVLVPGWRKVIEERMVEATRLRYGYVWSWKSPGVPAVNYMGDKIHHRAGYRWKHPVHEVLVLDKRRNEQVAFYNDNLIFHHPDNSKPRSQYFPLLELAVQEDPDDDRNSHYLGREYFFHGRYEEAIEELKRHLSLPRSKWDEERAASCRYIANCYLAQGADSVARMWLAQATKECASRDTWYEYARCNLQMKNYEEALAGAKNSLKYEKRPLHYLCDPVAWSYGPYDIAAVAAYYLGNAEESRHFMKIAIEMEPSDQRLIRNAAFILSEQNQLYLASA